MLDRRAFLAGMALAFTSPVVAGAQGKALPRIGVLWPNPPATFDWIRQGLADLGYVEGRSINFEYRWAEGKLDQLPQLAAELVRLPVDAIVTLAPPAAVAAKNATQTIPIVFVAIGDPVAGGLVASLAHPGGNLTGTTQMTSEMSVKHLEILRDVVPSMSRVCVLWNPGNSAHPPALKPMEIAAGRLRLTFRLLEFRRPEALDGVGAALTFPIRSSSPICGGRRISSPRPACQPSLSSPNSPRWAASSATRRASRKNSVTRPRILRESCEGRDPRTCPSRSRPSSSWSST